MGESVLYTTIVLSDKFNSSFTVYSNNVQFRNHNFYKSIQEFIANTYKEFAYRDAYKNPILFVFNFFRDVVGDL